MSATADDLRDLLNALPSTHLRYDPAQHLRLHRWLQGEIERRTSPVLVFRPLGDGAWQVGERTVSPGRCSTGVLLTWYAARREVEFALPADSLRNAVRTYALRWATDHAPLLVPVLESIHVARDGAVSFTPTRDCPRLILD